MNELPRIEAIEIAIEAVLSYIEEDCNDVLYNLTQEERELITKYKDRCNILIKDIVINTVATVIPYCNGTAKRDAVKQELISAPNVFDDDFIEVLLDNIDTIVE